MSSTHNEEGISRRSFLRNAILTAVAASATGAGAALLANKRESEAIISVASGPPASFHVPASPPPAVVDVPAVQSAQAVVGAHSDAADTLARLAEVQADNLRLQAALDAAQRELDSLRQANIDGSSATQELSAQLASATERIGILGGLVALYEELDGVDVTDAVQNGLDIVAGSVAGLLEATPGLSAGIETGEKALAEVETHLPSLENGRLWLESEIAKIGAFYDAVEIVLSNVLESVGTFLELVDEWFAGIQKWLPFGIGEKAAQVVTSLSALVGETPNTLSGLNTYVSQPLDAWVARDGDAPRLHNTLIKPIRQEVLARAGETVAQAQQVQDSYETQLAQPVQQLIGQRETVRQRLMAYREQYQI